MQNKKTTTQIHNLRLLTSKMQIVDNYFQCIFNGKSHCCNSTFTGVRFILLLAKNI